MRARWQGGRGMKVSDLNHEWKQEIIGIKRDIYKAFEVEKLLKAPRWSFRISSHGKRWEITQSRGRICRQKTLLSADLMVLLFLLPNALIKAWVMTQLSPSPNTHGRKGEREKKFRQQKLHQHHFSFV